ncbi:MAG: hypothetical protein LBF97_07910 [Elusimicrobiota bacterium]|nr:hypothetical protein [Elusimicrobiota bacterium]
MVLFFFDKHEFLYQESGRIEIMKKIFDDGFFVFLTGHGLGTSFNTLENFFPQNNINRTTVENGYATICYEIGIFIAILYLFMLLKSLSCSIRNNNRYNTFSCTSVILAIIISCFFVHTFVVSTVFLSFELIVFYQIYLNEMHKHQIIRYLRLERSNFE